MKTKNCVRCFKKAKLWTGHVLLGNKQITAGWCSEKCCYDQGFSGHYVDKMIQESDDK